MPLPFLRQPGWRSLAVAAVAIFFLANCNEPARQAPSRPNILLFSIDTLRADHLGCYGYSRDTSPVIDRFASESVRFSRAFAPAPWTLPSHAAMLSGRHPLDLGVTRRGAMLPSGVPLLAEPLAAAGYQTVAFVDSKPQGLLGGERGFARGFELYAHSPHREGLVNRNDMAASTDVAVRWLRRRDATRPFFMFLHTKSVHSAPPNIWSRNGRFLPYVTPDPYLFRFIRDGDIRFTWNDPALGKGRRYFQALSQLFRNGKMDPRKFPEEQVEVLKGLYDAGIYYVDEHFGRLLKEFEDLGLERNTIVILTSDHGEAFLEHSFFFHVEVYDQLLHIPLIIRVPGKQKGTVVRQEATLADIVPTVLHLVGVETPPGLSGRPLPLDPTPAKAAPRPLFAHVFNVKFNRYFALRLREGDWTIIYHNIRGLSNFEPELYNTRDDPGELHPVSGEDERRKRMLAAAVSRWSKFSPPPEGEVEPGSAFVERLRSLGYIP